MSYDYGSGLNDSISRLDALKESTTVLEGYSYLGLGTVVARSHANGVDLTYVKRSGESNGDAGDQYIGLDRFGRVVDQRWVVASSGTATDRFQYTYDRDGNRLTRANLVNSSFDETYTYDGLNQLASFARGSHTQAWDYDALGNFDSVTTDGGSPVTRSANAQNEITSISGLTTPTYDANGNMTTDQNGLKFYYDAWNRLVTVKNSAGTTTLTSYQYDGANRRVSENPGTARDLYYSAGWQVLEERVGGAAQVQYVWSPVYVDAIVERDRDTDANGSLDERLWVQQDANWNVTALVDGSGVVQERYAYDAYGLVSVYSASYSTRGGSSYAQSYLFQGRPMDSVTGNFDNRMRWYSPVLGRPIQADPLKFGAGDVNLYRWERNEPTACVDPSGLELRETTFNQPSPIVNDINKLPSSLTYPRSGFLVSDGYIANIGTRAVAGWKRTDDVTTISIYVKNGAPYWGDPKVEFITQSEYFGLRTTNYIKISVTQYQKYDWYNVTFRVYVEDGIDSIFGLDDVDHYIVEEKKFIGTVPYPVKQEYELIKQDCELSEEAKKKLIEGLMELVKMKAGVK